MILRPDLRGTHAITPRGLLVLPLSARRFTGLDIGTPIVAIAIPIDQVLTSLPPVPRRRSHHSDRNSVMTGDRDRIAEAPPPAQHPPRTHRN